MICVTYTEPDGPFGSGMRLEASGHAGYAPAGQDIVCAGASVLMQALACQAAGEENAMTEGWSGPDGPRMVVAAAAPQSVTLRGAFELVKTGFGLLTERYPENVRFVDQSRRGREEMVELQMFAEGETAQAEPALSRAQAQQAIASGTMKESNEKQTADGTGKEETPVESLPVTKRTLAQTLQRPVRTEKTGLVQKLHSRWAAEEKLLRQDVPGFSLRAELQNPEMRRLMQLPGMRMGDAYRLTHYNDALSRTAREVERGVVERIQQRAARPQENGTRPGSAAVTGTDVSRMTRAEREALERQALHGAKISL